mmetsp:Transcript_46473/g.124840  ORF Transcript_46473/g.124840 Transcript_46473/m.124840 type:complete len:399 (-) Transcript_46473:63-1259(-)
MALLRGARGHGLGVGEELPLRPRLVQAHGVVAQRGVHEEAREGGLVALGVPEVARVGRLVEVGGEEHDPPLEVVPHADEARADVPPPALQVLEGAPMPCSRDEARGLVRHGAVPVAHVGAHGRDAGHEHPVAVRPQLRSRACVLQHVLAVDLVDPRPLDERAVSEDRLHHAGELCALPAVLRRVAPGNHRRPCDDPPTIVGVDLNNVDGLHVGATPREIYLPVVVLEEEGVPVLVHLAHLVPDAREGVVGGEDGHAEGRREVHPVAHDHSRRSVVRQWQALRLHKRPMNQVLRVEVAAGLRHKEEVGVLVDHHRRVGGLPVLGLVGLEVVGEVQRVAEGRLRPCHVIRGRRALRDAPDAAALLRVDRAGGSAEEHLDEVDPRDPVAEQRDEPKCEAAR